MTDPLCDSCHQQRKLTLTFPSYAMLCFFCMDKKGEKSLIETVDEARKLIEQSKAMRKVWDGINKGSEK